MTKLRLGFLVLVINSGYLLSSNAATVFYAANVLAHVVVGIGLTLLAVKAYKKLGKRPVVTAGLALTALTGFVIVVAGSTPSTQFVLKAHVAIAALAALAVVVALRSKVAWACFAIACALPLAVVLRSDKESIPPVNASLPPVSMDGEAMGGKDGPFYPSAAQTTSGTTIPSKFFMGSEECGRCHTDIYQQWESSAHRKASFNNQWYRKSVEYMQSVVGVEPSKWCGGCHDHALLFSGMMDTPIDEIIETPEAHAGLACTSCHSVVRVKDTSGNAGFVIDYPELHDLATSDNPVVRALHDFVLHLDPEPHRETFLKPLHTGDSSAFCSTCHKVHLDVPVNNYRWLRGFNSYDNWQASGVSGEGARSFYYPAAPMTCTDCHMAPGPGDDPAAPGGPIRSHRFAAANTALPTAYGDEEQLQAVVDFLQAGQVTVDLFALVRSEGDAVSVDDGPSGQGRQIASTFAVGEEAEMAVPNRMSSRPAEEDVIAPLERQLPALAPGESVRIDAVVRTRGVGHFFPGGTVDAFDLWLELRAVDDEGRTIFWSGRTEGDGNGPVEPGAHFYRSLLLDGGGHPINKRNAWSARSTLYVQLIAPGSANTVRFRLQVPEDVGSEIRLEAKLNYRKFAWWHTQWAYAGERAPGSDLTDVTPDSDPTDWSFTANLDGVSGPLKSIPDVPIVTMATSTVTLPVGASTSADSEPPAKADALRWNDYGIGLLLQGDLKAAEAAFVEVTELDPDYVDGWVNVARVRVQEGDPDAAQAMLDEALILDPDLAKSHYFYGLTLKTQGLYDEALEHFRRAALDYPRDRVVRNQIGRLHFLKREFDEAIVEFEKTLRVDPEDLEAHYNLMLAYQGRGDAERAAAHRELYLRFKADEASQFLTGEYRRENPHDNNERLPIHEHRSALP